MLHGHNCYIILKSIHYTFASDFNVLYTSALRTNFCDLEDTNSIPFLKKSGGKAVNYLELSVSVHLVFLVLICILPLSPGPQEEVTWTEITRRQTC